MFKNCSMILKSMLRKLKTCRPKLLSQSQTLSAKPWLKQIFTKSYYFDNFSVTVYFSLCREAILRRIIKCLQEMTYSLRLTSHCAQMGRKLKQMGTREGFVLSTEGKICLNQTIIVSTRLQIGREEGGGTVKGIGWKWVSCISNCFAQMSLSFLFPDS